MVIIFLAGCTAQEVYSGEDDLVKTAAAEATAILQEAQATALVLAARAQATEVIQQALGKASGDGIPLSPTPVPQTSIASVPTQETIESTAYTPTGEGSTGPTDEEVEGAVEVIGVGFAADGGFIMVQFKAPPRIAQGWWQGLVSVTDEGNGVVYDEIVVMPVIGPLFARPLEYGQVGYVMLVNKAPGLQTGAFVTVMLGDYKFEHISVQ